MFRPFIVKSSMYARVMEYLQPVHSVHRHRLVALAIPKV